MWRLSFRGVCVGAVAESGSHDRVSEDARPTGTLTVRGVDDGLGFVRFDDDVEQESGSGGVDGEIAEFVDESQVGFADGGDGCV